ncbi:MULTISPECIES: flagellar basal body rod protein FlgB [unclassified Massilia]|jgi:flagellar basal-body rod protein FlgB|uniref:flagellar basal body rod protein FlgB n=1 Tax=unclassified Massilia TaxID=2609279 RepID=UPI0017854A2B|nr:MULTISPECIES: flagellar basal body rod protein FlgB [unclassified Massilia]MBD8528807.1 flagellar basal body rod protein FlgB [Massilia sp. CFBP 13647]MBD8673448.1 flagellar basal body rod protein FlgB [Massilia sp. CFBP 13721]
MIGKLDNYLRFNESALSLRAQRQELIASNIANADTPNFKARDIDFASAMQGALAKTNANAANPLAATNKGHIQPAADGKALPDGTPVLYRGVVQGAVDGNTVDMDVERNQFADNALRYEAGITMINHQIRGLMAAIQNGQ